jgi:hypothetical protein
MSAVNYSVWNLLQCPRSALSCTNISSFAKRVRLSYHHHHRRRRRRLRHYAIGVLQLLISFVVTTLCIFGTKRRF